MDPSVSSRAPATNLPNVLTYARIAAVPALVACLMLVEGEHGRWAAFWLFVAAAITDWLDGYLARRLAQQSTLGRMLDPIADKLIVGAALIMLVHDRTARSWSRDFASSSPSSM
jgi:CDP-diacylglycerol--glycerol-3-phosphate 3-phosphatidyltransferase/cardiolipin synthase